MAKYGKTVKMITTLSWYWQYHSVRSKSHCIRVIKLILTISLCEIKGKMSKLPKKYTTYDRQYSTVVKVWQNCQNDNHIMLTYNLTITSWLWSDIAPNALPENITFFCYVLWWEFIMLLCNNLYYHVSPINIIMWCHTVSESLSWYWQYHSVRSKSHCIRVTKLILTISLCKIKVTLYRLTGEYYIFLLCSMVRVYYVAMQ
jgi:hypothetical protein